MKGNDSECPPTDWLAFFDEIFLLPPKSRYEYMQRSEDIRRAVYPESVDCKSLLHHPIVNGAEFRNACQQQRQGTLSRKFDGEECAGHAFGIHLHTRNYGGIGMQASDAGLEK